MKLPRTAYKPGQSGNPKGKPKGAKSKVTIVTRDSISNIINDYQVPFRDCLDRLAKDNPAGFVKNYIDLLSYILPRHRATDLSLEMESLSDTQLEYLLETLKNSLK